MRPEPEMLWVIILGIGLGSFLIRFSFLWLFGRGSVSPRVERVLRFVPASALSALVLPSFVFGQQAPFSFENPRLWAGAVAALIAWKSRSVLLTIAAGMVCLWLFSL
ncbi:MAG: AzlD domain-containing protein [Syntrophobacteraceae bacterium]